MDQAYCWADPVQWLASSEQVDDQCWQILKTPIEKIKTLNQTRDSDLQFDQIRRLQASS